MPSTRSFGPADFLRGVFFPELSSELLASDLLAPDLLAPSEPPVSFANTVEPVKAATNVATIKIFVRFIVPPICNTTIVN